jgi:hypothetical protein
VPALDLDGHARRALALGLFLAFLVHGAFVAYGKLMPPLPKAKRSPVVVRPIDVEVEIAPPQTKAADEPIDLDETTIAVPIPTPTLTPTATRLPTPTLMMPEPPASAAPVVVAPPVARGPDRSAPARLGGKVTWRCPWPKEADPEMRHVSVRAQARVRADGAALRVTILDEPGWGFGREARLCALSHTYVPALGHDGLPADGDTLPFSVYFDRY